MVMMLAGQSAEAARPRFFSTKRAKKAVVNKEARLQATFKKRGLAWPPRRIFIRIFKKERVLELWARSRGSSGQYLKVKSYPVCYASGSLGPKRKVGDRQVPEGVYHVRVLNPWSSYHLSLGINYPNASDRILGYRPALGGAIMIHGDCVSIGCVAITDDLIEEVYVAAAWAMGNRQHKIPVHIFPTRLDREGLAWLQKRYLKRSGLRTLLGKLSVGQRKKWDRRSKRLGDFWTNLQPIYQYFETHRKLPRVRIDRRGRYRVR